MHCEKITLKSGQIRWECVADGPRNPATGKRNQIPRRGRTQKEAKAKVLAEIKRQEETGVNSKVAKKITFKNAADNWYKSYTMSGLKDSTYLKRRKEVKILNEQMAMHPIGEVTHSMYQDIIYEIFPKYAESTLSGVHSTANMIFKFSKKRKWIKENPATDVVLPKKQKTVEDIKKENIEEKFFNRDELDEFLSVASKYGLRHDIERFYILAFSGLRPGELCALKKSDLLFESNEIDVTKTLYNEKNTMKEFKLTPPKTPKSVRIIDMDPFFMNMLKKVVLENDKHKLQYRNLIEDFHDEDFVFVRKNGYPFNTIALNVRMNRLLKKTSIKKHATPHIFRHTHISMLTEAGVDLSTIMKRVGHEDMKTTMSIYTHVTEKMKKEAPQKMTNLYGNLLEKISFQK